MKKLLVTLISIIFVSTVFSQSFIGEKKKVVLNDIKKSAISIDKPIKDDKSDTYYIKVKFQTNTNWYSFTKDEVCYFYFIMQPYSLEKLNYYVQTYDNIYLRAFDKTELVWKEYKGDIFVYHWIVADYNRGYMYTVFLTKTNYDNNKYTYLQDFLGSK